MHRNRVAAMLAIAAVAGALVTGGCAAATTPPPAAATASARAAATTGDTANIMIYAVNTDGAYWHAIMSGMIGDYGPAVSIYPDGQVDPAHDSELELRLTRGSFRLSIAALDKKFMKSASHEPVYPKTCTDHISVIGTTPIVAASGHPHAERGRGEAVPAEPRRVPRATDHSGRLGDHLVLRHRNRQCEQVRQPAGRPAVVVSVSSPLATTVMLRRRAAVLPSRRPAACCGCSPRASPTSAPPAT
jgi:hypothetical protein